jgi:hypothetical protein
MRTEHPDPSVIKPQTIGGRAGRGTPDLGFKEGRTVELAEIKPAVLPYLAEGMLQLLDYYLLHGNSPENAGWRGQRRIDTPGFFVMNPSRATWPKFLTTNKGQRIVVGWCAPGLVGYRPLPPDEANTVICGVSDQKLIDKFLNSAVGQVQGKVEGWVQEKIGEIGDVTQRQLALDLEGKLLNAILRQIKGRFRTYLQESLTAACAEAAVGATVSVAQLLKKVAQDLAKMVQESLVVAEGIAAASLAAQAILRGSRAAEPVEYPEGAGRGSRDSETWNRLQPAPVSDVSLRQRIAEITGLTGWALTIYIILSEGSRIVFPPRNLIPAP